LIPAELFLAVIYLPPITALVARRVSNLQSHKKMKADLVIYNAKQLVTCASNRQPKRLLQMRDIEIIMTAR
jgi:ATP-dependent helicase YprA (DUF1998 family)